MSVNVIAELVTDAELEALEKQLQQKEEENRILEEKKIREEQQVKKRLADIEKQRIEDEKRSAEEAWQAELKQRQIEEETRKDAVQEKKNRYNLLITEANEALKNKDKPLALNKFNQVLALSPGDAIAQSGILEAEKLMDKICYQFVGTWELNEFVGSLMIRVKENGVFYHGNSNDSSTTWRCVPEKRQIIEGSFNLVYTMNESGDCLLVDFRKECFKRVGREHLIDNENRK
jgi:hypothetical protein